VGEGTDPALLGARVGVPWLGWVCGECKQCRAGRENLCERAEFTGYTRDGGFAELAVADARFCFPLDPEVPAAALAPLLCAGLIGYRALRMCGSVTALGLYGFGSSAHIVCQLAVARGVRVHAFTRPDDEQGRAFARGLGAVWAGPSDEPAPEPLDAAIIFAPVGALVPAALRAVGPGGRVVCAGIHMSDIPSFPYEELWSERSIRSVANLTREDGHELLAEAASVGVETAVRSFALGEANEAVAAIRDGTLEGSAVLELR
jgi:alcohol dehydrogenase, propanol-preferring